MQWNDLVSGACWLKTGQLLREHLAPRGWHRLHDDDRPARTPASTVALPRAHTAGRHISAVCTASTSTRRRWHPPGARRWPREEHGPAVVDDAAKAALDLGTDVSLSVGYSNVVARAADAARSIRSFGSSPSIAISSIAKQETRYESRELITRSGNSPPMAAVLETLRHAQTEKLTPTRSASCPTNLRRQDRPLGDINRRGLATRTRH